jgi:protein TonB
MFEYSVTKKHAMSGVSLLTSVVAAGMHVLLLGGIGVAALAATDVVPVPRSIAAFVAAPAPPPPPPPPPAADAARRTPAKVNRSRPPRAPKPAPVEPAPAPAPAVAPSEIPTEEVDAFAESGAEVESFGVEGGVPGGVVSGIVGGTLPTLPPPPPPAPPKPVRVGGHIVAPRMIHRAAPQYPRVARDGRVQGVVILEATVSAQGRVQSVRVLRANPLLQDAAVRAVKEWRYEPLLLNGTPTPFVLTVTVSFSLN